VQSLKDQVTAAQADFDSAGSADEPGDGGAEHGGIDAGAGGERNGAVEGKRSPAGYTRFIRQ